MRTPQLHNDRILSADQWNEALRYAPKDLLDLFLRLFWGDTDPSAGGRVVAGFVCAPVAGQRQSTVTKGSALYYDSTVYTASLNGNQTASPLGLIQTDTTTTLTHSDNTSGSTRYDIILVSSTLGTDNSQTVTIHTDDGGGTEAKALRWGPVTVVEVLEGTPGAGVPATPSGKLKVAEVEVPDGTTSANWSSATTYTDAREWIAGPLNRQDQRIDWHTTSTTGNRTLTTLIDGAGRTYSPSGWDIGNAWPWFGRPIGIASGEGVGAFYPMAIRNGREWWQNVPFLGAVVNKEVADATVTQIGVNPALSPALGGGVNVEHTTPGNAAETWITLPIPVQQRGLEVVGCEVHHAVGPVLAAGGTAVAKLYHYDASAAGDTVELVLIGSATLSNTAGSHSDALTMTDTPVLDARDSLYLSIDIDMPIDAGATNGNITLKSARVQFREGRA